MSLFSELRRRNVIKVFVLYMVASWLILQAVDIGINILDLPAWTGRFVFLMLLIGLPVALIFSWVYEITPEGLKREVDVDQTQSIVYKTGQKLNAAVAVLLVLVLVSLVLNRLFPDVPLIGEPGPPPELSIAVLPFDDMSQAGDQGYFADGLAEELISLLSQVPDLKVTSKTSSFSFRDKSVGVPVIAETLGVAHILEGSVRKDGERIRVTAQLISAADDSHLWSDTYDRELTDIFVVQDDIAESVLEALELELLDQDLPRAQRTSVEAYDLYQQATARLREQTPGALREARKLLEQALELDRDFGPAWLAYGFFTVSSQPAPGEDPEAHFRRALEAFLHALALNETSALTGLGWLILDRGDGSDTAIDFFRVAMERAPTDVGVLSSVGVLCGVFGAHEAQLAYAERVLERDPVNPFAARHAIAALVNLRRFYEARIRLEAFERTHDTPIDAYLSGALALAEGRGEEALALFQGLRDPIVRNAGLASAAFALGNEEVADASLAALMAMTERPPYLSIAAVHAHRGEVDLAFEALEQAIAARQPVMQQLRPAEGMLWANLVDDPRWQTLLERLGVGDAYRPADICAAN